MRQSYWQIDVLGQANYNPLHNNIFYISVARQRFIPVIPFGDARQLLNR